MQGSVGTRRTGARELPPAAPGSASAVLGGGSVLRAADVDVELIGAEILEVLAEAEAKASLAGPLPARGGASLLASRPAAGR
jgi:hypothetical protein